MKPISRRTVLKTIGTTAGVSLLGLMTGAQSQNFYPTDYVDITSVITQKHNACFAHESQNVREEYPNDHGRMELFRGMEYNCKYAESFVRHFQKPKRSIL